MHIGKIIKADVANGPGIRLSIFVSGCNNHCKGCFNPETWDFNYGEEFSDACRRNILQELGKPWYDGLTILGGDPFEISNQAALRPFLQEVKKNLPHKNIWMYTGYVYERDIATGCRHCGDTDDILSCIDVLVDGPFIEEQKNMRLSFRGSSNQRVIDIKKSRNAKKTVQKKEYL